MWRTEILVLAFLFAFHAHAEEEEKHEGGEAATPKAEASAEPELKQHAAMAGSRDVKLPAALVGRIEREYKEFLTKAEGVRDKESIKRSLVNIAVNLTQKRVGALQDDTRINTPTGGGVIDLADMITPVRAAFRAGFETKKDDGQPLVPSRVFFVSHAKRRMLGGEEYGDGCNKFLEITTAYRKKWEKNGMEVFTADQRYLSVLGGTFIFVEYAKEALYVGSVTFTDSRYPDVLCN
jgi:hypothetical protein